MHTVQVRIYRRRRLDPYLVVVVARAGTKVRNGHTRRFKMFCSRRRTIVNPSW